MAPRTPGHAANAIQCVIARKVAPTPPTDIERAAAPDGRRTEQPPHRTAAAPNGPDRLVNVEQGRWLARTIPGARGVILPDTGHGSIALPWEEVVGELVAAAG